MDNLSESPIEEAPVKGAPLSRITRIIYSVVFWLAILFGLLFDAGILKTTLAYDYFCGNPLMEAWASWFVVLVILTIITLPGAVWSLRHRKERMGIIFLIGLVVFLIGIIVVLIFGGANGTVPDFIYFI